MVVESHVAPDIHETLDFPVFTSQDNDSKSSVICRKTDMTVCFGGDGTVLHASSLFVTATSVPPILAFSMGTLGFLGEWNFDNYKCAFHEAYISGAEPTARMRGPEDTANIEEGKHTAVIQKTKGQLGLAAVNDQIMSSSGAARVLLRNRLKVRLMPFITRGCGSETEDATSLEGGIHYAMNEVILHRGKNPHLVIIEILIDGRFLTEAVADGLIISTPTGSTAYSLSSGGSIVHPLVPSVLLTPVCPRSLSFRPLVLPASSKITLRLSGKNRGREAEVSIDGQRWKRTMDLGMELQVCGENLRHDNGTWHGGVPCVVRMNDRSSVPGDDGWVGGLNRLLKFNYPFGEGR